MDDIDAEAARLVVFARGEDGPAHAANFIPTEDTLAAAFAEQHHQELRYCAELKTWLRWDGARWAPERRRLAFHYARCIARQFNGKSKPSLAKAATAGGVEKFAQADPSLSTVAEDWDADPWVLATPGGTVELRTGKLRPARPADMITKLAGATPSDEEDCPRWLRFLDETAGGDAELISFLKRWCGYCLTGDVREHALVFIYGDGGNGKSVFLETISAIVGDYATEAAMDTFAVSRGDKHSTDIAMLRGARFVTAAETEEGRAWAEARIKQITGGTRITARFMRQDNFTFDPHFKVTISGNHKPILRNVDDAMRRRFNLVPFTCKPRAIDPALKEKLADEMPGILRWCINGCLDWRVNGLVRPASVVAATANYFETQDLFGQWLEDACNLEPGNRALWETSGVLWESWQGYARTAGDDAGSRRGFKDKLEQRGAVWDRDMHARKFTGIELKPKGNGGYPGEHDA